MRVSAVRADLVATDAIGGGALIVTARAEQNIAARRSAVSAARARVIADPARGMRVPALSQARADPARGVASVAGLGRVATHAARRLRLRLDRMRGHEITAVHEVPLHGFGSPMLDAQVLRRVVATVAIGLCVARLAQGLLLGGVDPVVLHEVTLVPNEALREQLF